MAICATKKVESHSVTVTSVGHVCFLSSLVVVIAVVAALAGCQNTPVETSDYALGPAPLRMPSPPRQAEACRSYEDSLTGGQVFAMYCSYCHNAPSLAERPYAQFRNIAAHMRVRANLTGKEYAKLMEFLRRWNDVPPPTAPVEPSPKRFIFSQPIQELRDQTPGQKTSPQAAVAPGAEPPAQSMPAPLAAPGADISSSR
jgi:hypothetical protein